MSVVTLMDSFRGYGHCSFNLLAETNDFGLSSFLLSCLFFGVTEIIFTGTQTQNRFLDVVASTAAISHYKQLCY